MVAPLEFFKPNDADIPRCSLVHVADKVECEFKKEVVDGQEIYSVRRSYRGVHPDDASALWALRSIHPDLSDEQWAALRGSGQLDEFFRQWKTSQETWVALPLLAKIPAAPAPPASGEKTLNAVSLPPADLIGPPPPPGWHVNETQKKGVNVEDLRSDESTAGAEDKNYEKYRLNYETHFGPGNYDPVKVEALQRVLNQLKAADVTFAKIDLGTFGDGHGVDQKLGRKTDESADLADRKLVAMGVPGNDVLERAQNHLRVLEEKKAPEKKVPQTNVA